MTAITRSENHDYTYQGQTYPGTTGILKVIDKSAALMAWASRNTAEAAVSMIMQAENDLISQSPIGVLLDTVGVDGTVKALTSRSEWKRDEAASLGSEIHDLADGLVRGQPLPEMAENVRDRVVKYADWWNACGWTLRTSEALLVNPSIGYGGTLDLLARDRDGRTVLADIKTGRAVYHEAVLQLTAYAMAEVLQDHNGQVFKMPEVDRYVILHVTLEGVREVEVTVGSAEQAAFRACVELSLWRASMKGKRL